MYFVKRELFCFGRHSPEIRESASVCTWTAIGSSFLKLKQFMTAMLNLPWYKKIKPWNFYCCFYWTSFCILWRGKLCFGRHTWDCIIPSPGIACESARRAHAGRQIWLDFRKINLVQSMWLCLLLWHVADAPAPSQTSSASVYCWEADDACDKWECVHLISLSLSLSVINALSSTASLAHNACLQGNSLLGNLWKVMELVG